MLWHTAASGKIGCGETQLHAYVRVEPSASIGVYEGMLRPTSLLAECLFTNTKIAHHTRVYAPVCDWLAEQTHTAHLQWRSV